MDPLHGKVVVVTGASSGLGRETAIQLAARGCRVALAARRESELERTARLCGNDLRNTLVVRTDVTREEDVDRLALAVVERWGCIDAWINNAGVTLYAPLEGGPFEEHRRVIETNLYGSIHGARAAVPIFRRQGHGVLVNVCSVLSKVGHAFVPSYVISKFAQRGLTEALRVELADEPNIHVCSIFPYAIDTPHFENAANELGFRARALAPVQSPEKVARAIVGLVERPRRERHVPRGVPLWLGWHSLRPRTIERLVLHALERWHLEGREQLGEGNLFRPLPGGSSIHGRRKPRIAAPALFVWALREYVQLEIEAARTAISRWLPRPRQA
jgi:NAD(P)-dependent dehydrogenase (short-subunit alcohol dehydrogenase family)